MISHSQTSQQFDSKEIAAIRILPDAEVKAVFLLMLTDIERCLEKAVVYKEVATDLQKGAPGEHAKFSRGEIAKQLKPHSVEHPNLFRRDSSIGNAVEMEHDVSRYVWVLLARCFDNMDIETSDENDIIHFVRRQRRQAAGLSDKPVGKFENPSAWLFSHRKDPIIDGLVGRNNLHSLIPKNNTPQSKFSYDELCYAANSQVVVAGAIANFACHVQDELMARHFDSDNIVNESRAALRAVIDRKNFLLHPESDTFAHKFNSAEHAALLHGIREKLCKIWDISFNQDRKHPFYEGLAGKGLIPLLVEIREGSFASRLSLCQPTAPNGSGNGKHDNRSRKDYIRPDIVRRGTRGGEQVEWLRALLSGVEDDAPLGNNR